MNFTADDYKREECKVLSARGTVGGRGAVIRGPPANVPGYENRPAGLT